MVLNQLHVWSNKCLLRFSPDKCKVTHIGHDYTGFFIQYNVITLHTNCLSQQRKEMCEFWLLINEIIECVDAVCRSGKKQLENVAIANALQLFSGISVLTLALCARLSWLPVSF